MKDEYTFVTLDYDVATTGDAIFVDIDDSVDVELDFVQIDDACMQLDGTANEYADFITLDDTDMVNNMDINSYFSDINEFDVTIIL